MANNRATTRICAKKLFIAIECKILTTHKKSKQTSLLAGQKHATFYTLVWTWMKSAKFKGKMEKIKAKNVLKVKDPKLLRLACSVQLEKTDCRKLAVFPWATTTLLFWQTNSYGCSRGLRRTLPVLKLLDRTSLFLFPVNVFRPKFAAAGLVFRQICETRNWRTFFDFIFPACWIRA